MFYTEQPFWVMTNLSIIWSGPSPNMSLLHNWSFQCETILYLLPLKRSHKEHVNDTWKKWRQHFLYIILWRILTELLYNKMPSVQTKYVIVVFLIGQHGFSSVLITNVCNLELLYYLYTTYHFALGNSLFI